MINLYTKEKKKTLHPNLNQALKRSYQLTLIPIKTQTLIPIKTQPYEFTHGNNQSVPTP